MRIMLSLIGFMIMSPSSTHQWSMVLRIGAGDFLFQLWLIYIAWPTSYFPISQTRTTSIYSTRSRSIQLKLSIWRYQADPSLSPSTAMSTRKMKTGMSLMISTKSLSDIRSEQSTRSPSHTYITVGREVYICRRTTTLLFASSRMTILMCLSSTTTQ